MNKAYKDLIKQGYQTIGLILQDWKDKAEIEARAKEYRVMGNKVRIVRKVDVTQYRDRTDRSGWWVVMVLFSEEWKADQKAKWEAHHKEQREKLLKDFTAGCSLEELTWMVNYKMAQMMQEKLDLVNSEEV